MRTSELYQYFAYGALFAALVWLPAHITRRRQKPREHGHFQPPKSRREDQQEFHDILFLSDRDERSREILHRIKSQKTIQLEEGTLDHSTEGTQSRKASTNERNELQRRTATFTPGPENHLRNPDERQEEKVKIVNTAKLPPISMTLRLRNLPATATEEELRQVLANLWSTERVPTESDPSDDYVRRISLIRSVEAEGLADKLTATVCLAQPQPPLDLSLKKESGFIDGEMDLLISGKHHDIIVDDHFLGLTPLYSHTNRDIDIIAVTGWHGRAFWSWKPADGKLMWLRDWLGPDLADRRCRTRIYTYGYPSQVAASDSDATIHDYGQGLLSAISAARSADFKAGHSRPIVFIGHSLGGLVIKQALKDAARSDIPSERNIAKSVLGSIMFGVPNRGMNNLSLIPMTEGRPNETLARTLGYGSPYLLELDRDFSANFDMPLFAIFETFDSPSVVRVDNKWSRSGPKVRSVTRESACSGSTEQLPSHTNHSDLAKIQNKYSNVYQSVLKRICDFADRRERRSNSHLRVPSYLEKHFVGRDSTLTKMDQCLVSAEGQQTFVLIGTGGMGKTQIALKHISLRSDMYSRVLWIRSDTEQNLEESFHSFAETLGLSHHGDDTQRVLRHLTDIGQKFLLVYDNLDDPVLTQTIGKYHRDLWSTDCKVIITTRDRKFLTFQTNSSKVGPLEAPDARILLGDLLGLEASNTPKRDSTLDDICYALGNLPLGIQQAAAYINYSGIGTSGYLNQLRSDTKRTLQYVGDWWPYKATLLEAWETSLAKIEKHKYARKWFLLCCLLDREIPYRFFEVPYQYLRRTSSIQSDNLHEKVDWLYSTENSSFWTVHSLRNRLIELAGLSLINIDENDEDTSFGFYPLVQEWAKLRSAPAEKEEYLIQAAILLYYCLEQLAYDAQSTQDGSTAFLSQRWLLPHVHACIRFSSCYIGRSIAEIIPLQCSAAFAMLLIHENKPLEAQSMMEMAIPKESSFRSDELTARRVLALALRRQERPGAALPIQQAVVQDMEQCPVPSRLPFADVLHAREELATIHRDLKDYRSAYDVQIDVVEKCKDYFGANHLRSLHAQACLATILSRRGQYADAAAIEEHILEVYEMTYPDRPEILTKKRNLAVSYYNLERYDDAVDLERDVLNGVRELYGDDHAETGTAMHNLGASYLERGLVRPAIVQLAEALSIRRKTLGESHRRTRKTATLLVRANVHNKADQLPKGMMQPRDSGLG